MLRPLSMGRTLTTGWATVGEGLTDDCHTLHQPRNQVTFALRSRNGASKMSDFLAQTEGFTPVIDALAKEEGLMTAVVYGIVWRYCQQKDRVCYASRDTIADHAGISTKTVERHLKKLVKSGYLIDLTPDLKHKPHTYADAGRAKILGFVAAVAEPRSDRKSYQPDGESYPGQTESLTKKVLQETKEETIEGAGAPIPNPVTDPDLFTVKEIRALDLSREEWEKLWQAEKRSKKRRGVATHVRASLNAPPPAIEVYKQVVERYPKRALWPGIEKTVGDAQADLEFWERVVKNYVACGWNQMNVSGMLDYFQRRDLPSTNGGNGNGRNGHHNRLAGQRGASSGVSGAGGDPVPAISGEKAKRFRKLQRERAAQRERERQATAAG